MNSRRLLATTLALLLALAPAHAFDMPEGASGLAPKPLVKSKRHMIVAANPLAAEAGLTMLRKGGSAIDAGIAAQMVLNLVEPQSSGIGGGAFMLYWEAAAKTLTSYDGRETAPAGATPEPLSMPTASRLSAIQPCTADCRSAYRACSPP
ncbi:MAG: gamma-glutamyltransferase [Hyphomicrobiales bacterium]